MKFFSKDFFSNCDQIRSFLGIWTHFTGTKYFLNLTKDEVHLKWKFADGLKEATKESNKALESILQSKVEVEKLTLDGLALLGTNLSVVQT